METTTFEVSDNCHCLEIIMLYRGTYDFSTLKAVNRKRFRRFKNFFMLHRKAHRIFSKSVARIITTLPPIPVNELSKPAGKAPNKMTSVKMNMVMRGILNKESGFTLLFDECHKGSLSLNSTSKGLPLAFNR